jgi:hypothetical protein
LTTASEGCKKLPPFAALNGETSPFRERTAGVEDDKRLEQLGQHPMEET